MEVRRVCLLLVVYFCDCVEFSKSSTSIEGSYKYSSVPSHPTFPSRPLPSSVRRPVWHTTLFPTRSFPSPPTLSPSRTKPTRPTPRPLHPLHPNITRLTTKNPDTKRTTPRLPSSIRPDTTPSAVKLTTPRRPGSTRPTTTRPTSKTTNPRQPSSTRPTTTRPTVRSSTTTHPTTTHTSITRPTLKVTTPQRPDPKQTTSRRLGTTSPTISRPEATRPTPKPTTPRLLSSEETTPWRSTSTGPHTETSSNNEVNEDIVKPNRVVIALPDLSYPWNVLEQESSSSRENIGKISTTTTEKQPKGLKFTTERQENKSGSKPAIYYEIHDYHHNGLPESKQGVIHASAIVKCVLNIHNFCPVSTHALCTDNGTVMCVADVADTYLCTNIKPVNCIRSLKPCLNTKAAECLGKTPEDKIFTDVPCMYTIKVIGNITYVNNSIVLVPPPPAPKGTALLTTTEYLVTTMPPTLGILQTVKQIPPQQEQQFCVAVIAQPSERKNLTTLAP